MSFQTGRCTCKHGWKSLSKHMTRFQQNTSCLHLPLIHSMILFPSHSYIDGIAVTHKHLLFLKRSRIVAPPRWPWMGVEQAGCKLVTLSQSSSTKITVQTICCHENQLRKPISVNPMSGQIAAARRSTISLGVHA